MMIYLMIISLSSALKGFCKSIPNL